MPVDRRDDQFGKLERELVHEDAALAGLEEGATLEQIEATRNMLRQVCERAKQRQLEPDDWALLRAVLQGELRRRRT